MPGFHHLHPALPLPLTPSPYIPARVTLRSRLQTCQLISSNLAVPAYLYPTWLNFEKVPMEVAVGAKGIDFAARGEGTGLECGWDDHSPPLKMLMQTLSQNKGLDELQVPV